MHLVVFHRNCTDGTAAMHVVKRWLGDREAKYFAMQYKEALPVELTKANPLIGDCDVVVVDFSFPRETLIWLKENARSLTVLDHHASAAPQLEGIEGCHFDNNHSGAMLAWMHYFPNEEAPEIVKLAEDYDLWRYNYPDTKAICAAARHHLKDESWWRDALEGWGRDTRRDIMVLGEMLLEIQAKSVAHSVSTAIRTRLFEYRTTLANVTSYTSEVGEALCKHYGDKIHFSTTYFITPEGKVILSFRSNNGFDVSEVAARLGGGGHKPAAGAPVTLDLLKTLYMVRIEEDE